MKRRYGGNFSCSKKHSLRQFSSFTVLHFIKKSGVRTTPNHVITIPKKFSFYHNFDETIKVFQTMMSYFSKKEICPILDFSNCEYACISALTLLRIYHNEYISTQKRYQRIDNLYEVQRMEVKPSYKNMKVKKHLHALGFYLYDDFKDEDGELLSLDLIRGKYRHSYQENTKGKAIKQIVEFINNSFQPVNKSLTEKGTNTIESLVSEILNNAEDHSPTNGQWYANGVAFSEVVYGQHVVEINLSIINFGDSMFEGFEGTKELNKVNYEKVDKKYKEHSSLFTSSNKFERESLFMLYMLNEGISRLKYEDSSRGNGTMQFLDAFRTLGIFGKTDKNFNSLLNVISGHSVLSCDSQIGPYFHENHLKLSLNKENDLSLLPDKAYLRYNREFFPGTIIECRIYLNEQHLDEILKNGKE